MKHRISVFIDHSNVVHSLVNLKKVDPAWVRWYDPRKLAFKLIGNRKLVSVNFYCVPPPAYLLQEGKNSKEKYWKQMNYYGKVEKLPDVTLKYGQLSGVRGDLHEKNLDTQLSTDLILSASRNDYDTAVLVSNDGDYVAPVEAVQQLGRRVELLYFKNCLSWNLRRVCSIIRRARRSYFEEIDFEEEK